MVSENAVEVTILCRVFGILHPARLRKLNCKGYALRDSY